MTSLAAPRFNRFMRKPMLDQIRAIAATVAQPFAQRVVPFSYPHTDYPALGGKHIAAGARLFATRDDLLGALTIPAGATIAEVGVAAGDFSETMLGQLEPSRFVAMDLFRMHEAQSIWGRPPAIVFDGLDQRGFLERRLARWRDRLTIEVGISTDCLARYADNSFDLIYIDAGHDYANVKADTELAQRKVKRGGVLMFNDYVMIDAVSGAPYGVVQAVNELVVAENWQVIGFGLQRRMFCDIAIRRP